jgi:hypothetical protein
LRHVIPFGGGKDDTAQIQTAVNNCPLGQVVLLNAGTFNIDNSNFIQINKGITLRGSGPGATVLFSNNAYARVPPVVSGTTTTGAGLNNQILSQANPDFSGNFVPIIVVGETQFPRPDSTTSQNLTADGVQGATSVTIANASGFTAGQQVLLDEISLWSYVPVPPGGGAMIKNVGIENLSTKGGSDGSIRFEVAAYGWVKNVEVTQWRNEGIAIDNSFRIEIRHCYIHTTSEPTPGGGGYALSLANAFSEILIEDNISRDVNKVIVSRASGAGSVVAYNYMDDGWISRSRMQLPSKKSVSIPRTWLDHITRYLREIGALIWILTTRMEVRRITRISAIIPPGSVVAGAL